LGNNAADKNKMPLTAAVTIQNMVFRRNFLGAAASSVMAASAP